MTTATPIPLFDSGAGASELAGALAREGAAIVRGVDVADDDALLAVIGRVCAPTADGNGDRLIFDVTPGEGGDRSSQHTPFELHTDSTFLPEPHDVIALGCQTPDPEGGESLVARADHVCALVEERHGADVLSALEAPSYPFAILPPGTQEGTAHLLPILARGARTTVRYRQDILSGLQARGIEINAHARAALEAFEDVLADEATPSSYMLEAGDVLLVDNREALHGRRGMSPSSRRLLRRVKGFRQ